MGRFLNWFAAPAVLATLLAALLALHAPAGPVPAIGQLAAKIPKIEQAGELLKRGQVDEAYKLLQEAVREHPQLPPAKLMLARLLLATNEGRRQGRTLLEQVAAEDPDHPHVYLTIGHIALSEGRLTEALLACQRALDVSAADRWTVDQKKEVQSEARMGLAFAYQARQDWAGARDQIVALLEADPKNGPLRQRLATALFFLDQPDTAFAELQKAVQDDPTLEPAAVAMGRLWSDKGDLIQARAWLDRAVQADPASIRVRLAYADWLLQQNEIQQAKVHSDAAVKLRPSDPDVLRLQGLIARLQEDYPTAEKIYHRVLLDIPSDFIASNQLALVLAEQSNPDQRKRALQYAEVNVRQYALHGEPRAPEALATLGYVRFKNGDFDGAIEALKAAAAGGQVSSDTAYYLALSLDQRNQHEDAKKILRGALDTKGLFVYRKKAQTLYDELEKKVAAKAIKDEKGK